MTGYLTRLAARVGGLDGAPSGALRSRPVSRFEEVESDLRVGDAFHDASDDAVDVAPPSPSRQRPRQYAEGAPPTSSDARTDRHAGVAPPTAAGSARAEGAPTPMAPSVTGPPSTPAAAGAPGAGDDLSPAPSAPPGRPVEDRPARPARQAAAAAVTAVVTDRHPVGVAPVRRSPSPPAVTAVTPAAAGSARQAPSPLRPRAAAPLGPSRPEGREEASAAAPVVHVTIGRVEVKAVDANAARPAPRRAGPPAVTTLDAYLRRRAREQA